MFNPAEPAPTLAAIRQLSEDLLDGKLDGLRGAQPAVAAGRRTYDPNTLTGELTSALAEQAERFGTQAARGLLPRVLNFGNSRYEGYLFDASLKPGGEAVTTVAGWVAEDSLGRPVGTESPRKLPGRVFGVFGNLGHGGVFLKSNAIDSQSKLYGFGDNIAGELGNGETGVGTRGAAGLVAEIIFPTTAAVTHVAGGFAHTVARMADGTVYTWGDNSYSQLGQGVGSPALIRSEVPLPVALPGAAIAVAASNTASYALLEDGRVYSWGSSWGFGLLGDGVKDSVRNSPGSVMTSSGELSGVTQITARDNDVMVTRSDGTVWTWGSFPSESPFAYTEGDVSGAYRGGSPLPTQITGLDLAPGVQIRKILAEQGLFVVLTDDGAVYTWGVHFDITAQAVLRDLAAVRVLGLPRVRDLMPGGFIGYGSRPFDRLTAMAIDYRGNMWKVRGRVAEQYDPANPSQQRRPQGQAARPDCVTCHLVLTDWPLTAPAPTTNNLCIPPASFHGEGSTSLIHADTPCEQCHNPARTVDKPSFTNGWLNCIPPTNLPARSAGTSPATLNNACTVPVGHAFTPPGTVCSTCHNSIIARPLQSLSPPCAQPTSGQLPSIATTASITSVVDDSNLPIAPGGITPDATPTLRGTLSTALSAGQSLLVRRNGTAAGIATASGTSWSFVDSGASDGTQTYTVRVESGPATFGQTSNAFTLVIDTVAPTLAATISGVLGDGIAIAQGAATSDTTPTVTGTLGAAPATGELVRVFRNAAALAAPANVNGLIWSITEPTPLADGTYGYTARVVDAAGNAGPLSASWSVVINTSLPTASIVSAFNDQDVAIPANSATSDATPRLQGSISAALISGQSVTVLRNGTPLTGSATVTGTTWTYTDPGAPDATHAYTARVNQGSLAGQQGAGFVIQVDTTAPAITPSVTAIIDQFLGVVPDGGISSDDSPQVNGSLPAALGTGEALQLLRNGAVLSGASITFGTATTWSYQEGILTQGATYAYTARVIDAAGNIGSTSPARTVVIDTAVRSAGITTAFNQELNIAIDPGTATSDVTPRIDGNVNIALLQGQWVRVLRDGTPVSGQITPDSNRNWSFTDSITSPVSQTFTYSARVESAGVTGPASSTYAFLVDNTAPVNTVTAFDVTADVAPFTNLPGSGVDTPLPSPHQSNDPSPRLVVTLSAALAAASSTVSAESVVLSRNGLDIPAATLAAMATPCPAGSPASTTFCFRDTASGVTLATPGSAQVSGNPATPFVSAPTSIAPSGISVPYSARIRDAAGNSGTPTARTVVYNYLSCNLERGLAASNSDHANLTVSSSCTGCHTPNTTVNPTFIAAPRTDRTYWCRLPPIAAQ